MLYYSMTRDGVVFPSWDQSLQYVFGRQASTMGYECVLPLLEKFLGDREGPVLYVQMVTHIPIHRKVN